MSSHGLGVTGGAANAADGWTLIVLAEGSEGCVESGGNIADLSYAVSVKSCIGNGCPVSMSDAVDCDGDDPVSLEGGDTENIVCWVCSVGSGSGRIGDWGRVGSVALCHDGCHGTFPVEDDDDDEVLPLLWTSVKGGEGKVAVSDTD